MTATDLADALAGRHGIVLDPHKHKPRMLDVPDQTQQQVNVCRVQLNQNLVLREYKV